MENRSPLKYYCAQYFGYLKFPIQDPPTHNFPSTRLHVHAHSPSTPIIDLPPSEKHKTGSFSLARCHPFHSPPTAGGGARECGARIIVVVVVRGVAVVIASQQQHAAAESRALYSHLCAWRACETQSPAIRMLLLDLFAETRAPASSLARL